MSSNKEIRAQAILDALREITGEARTSGEVAAMVGRTPGGGFSQDLALARQMALDAGENITTCIYEQGYLGDGEFTEARWRGRRGPNGEEQGAYVMRHLLPGQENGHAAKPMMGRAADAISRMRNAGRYGAWYARNAEDAMSRRFGQIVARTAEKHEADFKDLAFICDEIRKARQLNQR